MSLGDSKKKYLRRAKQLLQKKPENASKRLQASVEPFSQSRTRSQLGNASKLELCTSEQTSVGPLVQRVTPTLRNDVVTPTETQHHIFPGASSEKASSSSSGVDTDISSPVPQVAATVATYRSSSCNGGSGHYNTPPMSFHSVDSGNSDSVGQHAVYSTPLVASRGCGQPFFEDVTPQASPQSLEVECRLQLQTDINKELKRLLVASMGNDLQYRLNQIAEEKASISQSLDLSLHQLMENHEEIDKVSIECDIWKSKFMASRLMVDELAGWKAEVTRQLRESQKALQCMLNENSELRNTLLQCNHHLCEVITYCKKHEEALEVECGNWHGETLLEVARANCSKARVLHTQLIGNEGLSIEGRGLQKIGKPTVGERLARQALNIGRHPSFTGEEPASPIISRLHEEQLSPVGFTRFSAPSHSSSHSSTSAVQQYRLGSKIKTIMFHCNRCKGKIYNV